MSKSLTIYLYYKVSILAFSCRFFNEFLMANERHVAKEVRDEYLDTMNKIYYSYFKGYLSRLMKLQVKYLSEIQIHMAFVNSHTCTGTL